MLFSIVIPVHNGEKYIKQCVDSALAQEGVDGIFEVVIVENGSGDSTAEIVDGYADTNKNVKVLHLGKIGLFAARQEGFLKAEGDYVISLDGDDKLEPCALKELKEHLSQDSWKDVDMVIYRAKVLKEDGTGAVKSNYKLEDDKVYTGDEKEAIYRIFCHDDSLNSMWTKCIKRSIATMEHDVFLNYGEDLYQTTRYLERAASIGFIDKALYCYRQDDTSMSSTYSELYLTNQKIVWSAMDEFLVKRANPEYDNWVYARKTLTCAINVCSIIYSSMGPLSKKRALQNLMQDEFYKKYALNELPDWAPESTVFVHELMTSANPARRLMSSARKNCIKTVIKRALR